MIVCHAAAGQSSYRVGVAQVDITPDYPIRLNGFGSRRAEATQVRQPIWAKALALESPGKAPVVLITVDSLGIRQSMADEVARRLHESEALERARLAVTFTHSHSTPKLVGASDTIFSSPIPVDHQKHIDRYTKELTDALERVARDALADRRPSRLEWGTGEVHFAKNRRTEGGPVDHDLPILVVRSDADNAIRAIYISYACHCVTFTDNQISGDWAGYAGMEIERRHPGAVALVSIGCGSDSNPTSRATEGSDAAAIEQAEEIAREVDRLLKSPLVPVRGEIQAVMRTVDLPLATLPNRETLESLAAHEDPAGYNAKYQLGKLDRGEPLLSKIDYPIQTWTLGDSLAMVFLAGEVCVDYSLQLKHEFDRHRLWVHGYSNDFCSYIPSERLLREGGYGGGAEVVYFALPATLAPGLEDRILKEVRRQVPSSFRSADRTGFVPTRPADALSAMEVIPGQTVELVAAEPLVEDPVAIDFGADGRLWVAEMPDYSHFVDDVFEQNGSVKVLFDQDHDGRFDEATVFEGGLRFPTDVMVWRQGILVCDAPDVFYLEDTDGDGQADLRKKLLTGFATHNAQARVNSLRWGLDGWVYGSCGLFGGHIRSFRGDEVELGTRDFRFQPDTGELEPVTGRTQQGRARDDWGNWFGCENGSLGEHYPLDEHYLARNPHLIPPATEVSVPAGPDPSQLFPLGDPVLFQLSGAPGRPTSACGLEIYRDELLGAPFRGNLFVAEPVNQLVHRRQLIPRGVTFAGLRAQEESHTEFLRSSDHWFRPVQIRTGLDGCLWVVDMCRYVIEHPKFIPQETLQSLDPMAGRTAGRIYRVLPGSGLPRPVPDLEALDTAGLVAVLESPNGPLRDRAQQMLLHREDRSAVPLLENLVTRADRPETRLQAMCTLAGLGQLTWETTSQALKDVHPGVRRHAIRLSESFLNQNQAAGKAILDLLADSDLQVSLQLAYTLGEWKDARAASALGQMAHRWWKDPNLLAAILSSVRNDHAATFVKESAGELKPGELPVPLREAVILIATHVADDACRRDVLTHWCTVQTEGISTSQLEAVAALLEALDVPQRQRLVHLPSDDSAGILRMVTEAQTILKNPAADRPQVLAALNLSIAAGANTDVANLAIRWLHAQQDLELQRRAVTLIAQHDPTRAGELLLPDWSRYTPALRAHLLATFFSRDDLLSQLVKGLASGIVPPALVDANHRQQLVASDNPTIRQIAMDAFQGTVTTDRQRLITSYAEAARLPGQKARGRELFVQHCSSCHVLDQQGHAVGPDLAALTDRSPTSLMESILDPNRAVDERYHGYIAETDDGRVFTGVLAQETAGSITLVGQDGIEHTLLRRSLAELTNSGMSAMPEGFERDLSVRDLADLLAYLIAQGQ